MMRTLAICLALVSQLTLRGVSQQAPRPANGQKSSVRLTTANK